MTQPISTTHPGYQTAEGTDRSRVSVFFIFFLAVLITGLMTALLFLKAGSTLGLDKYPVLFFYSIFITTFQLSRVGASFFYKPFSSKNKNGNRKKYFNPKVSFIVPCKNEEKVIETSVSKCFQVDYPMDRLEVIVINDGSTDKTGKVLKSLQKRFAGLTVITFEKNKGKRHAMAEGIKRAKGEIIVQMDSDSWVEASTFRNLINPFSDPGVGAVCAHAEPANSDKNFLTRLQTSYYFMSFRILKSVESVFESVFCCSGCASAYRKSAIEDILPKWLNEKFLGKPVTYGDDRSLTGWVLRGGYRTVYESDAKAYTVIPEKFRQLAIQQTRWKKSWFINAFITGRFIFFKRPAVALFYFLPLVLISFINPFMWLYVLVYFPLNYSVFPLLYLLGIFLITAIVASAYKVFSPKNKYWMYLFGWSLFNIVFLTPLMFYAMARIQDRGWGTR